MYRRSLSLVLIVFIPLMQGMCYDHFHSGTDGHEHDTSDLPHFHLHLLLNWSGGECAHSHGEHDLSRDHDEHASAVPCAGTLSQGDDDSEHDEDAVYCPALNATARRATSFTDEVAVSRASWSSLGLQDVFPHLSRACGQPLFGHSIGPPPCPLFLRMLNLRI